MCIRANICVQEWAPERRRRAAAPARASRVRVRRSCRIRLFPPLRSARLLVPPTVTRARSSSAARRLVRHIALTRDVSHLHTDCFGQTYSRQAPALSQHTGPAAAALPESPNHRRRVRHENKPAIPRVRRPRRPTHARHGRVSLLLVDVLLFAILSTRCNLPHVGVDRSFERGRQSGPHSPTVILLAGCPGSAGPKPAAQLAARPPALRCQLSVRYRPRVHDGAPSITRVGLDQSAGRGRAKSDRTSGSTARARCNSRRTDGQSRARRSPTFVAKA